MTTWMADGFAVEPVPLGTETKSKFFPEPSMTTIDAIKALVAKVSPRLLITSVSSGIMNKLLLQLKLNVS